MEIVQMPPKTGAEHTGEGRAAYKWSRGAAEDRRWGWWHIEGGSEKGAGSPGSILPHTEGPQEGAAAPKRSRQLCFTRQSALEQREEEEEKLSRNCQDPATQAAVRRATAPLPLGARESESCACLIWSQSLLSSSRSSLPGLLRGSPGQSCALLTAVSGQETSILLAPREHSLDGDEGVDPQGCNLGTSSRHSQLHHHSSAGLGDSPQHHSGQVEEEATKLAVFTIFPAGSG